MVWNLNGLWLSIDWDCHHPNWRTHIFQRGRSTTNQIKYPMIVNNLSLYVRGILPSPILVFFRCTDDSRSLITCGNLWLKTDVLHGATMVAPWLSPKPMRFTIDPDMNGIQCYTSLNFFDGWAEFFRPFFSGPRFYSNKGMFCCPGLAILKQHRDWDQNISSRRDRTWTPE